MNIKTTLGILSCITFLTYSPAARCADQPSAIRMAIDIPLWTNQGLPELKNDGGGSRFFVVIENISPKPIILSYYTISCLYLEITDDKGKTTNVEPLTAGAGGAAPPFGYGVKLSPKEMTVVEIDFGKSENYDIPFPPNGKSSKVTIRAVMEEGLDKDSMAKLAKEGYWFGKAGTESRKVTLIGSNKADKP
jgi:hypothetical protein